MARGPDPAWFRTRPAKTKPAACDVPHVLPAWAYALACRALRYPYCVPYEWHLLLQGSMPLAEWLGTYQPGIVNKHRMRQARIEGVIA